MWAVLSLGSVTLNVHMIPALPVSCGGVRLLSSSSRVHCRRQTVHVSCRGVRRKHFEVEGRQDETEGDDNARVQPLARGLDVPARVRAIEGDDVGERVHRIRLALRFVTRRSRLNKEVVAGMAIASTTLRAHKEFVNIARPSVRTRTMSVCTSQRVQPASRCSRGFKARIAHACASWRRAGWENLLDARSAHLPARRWTSLSA